MVIPTTSGHYVLKCTCTKVFQPRKQKLFWFPKFLLFWAKWEKAELSQATILNTQTLMLADERKSLCIVVISATIDKQKSIQILLEIPLGQLKYSGNGMAFLCCSRVSRNKRRISHVMGSLLANLFTFLLDQNSNLL